MNLQWSSHRAKPPGLARKGFDDMLHIDIFSTSHKEDCLLYRCCRSYQHRSLEAWLSLSRVFIEEILWVS